MTVPSSSHKSQRIILATFLSLLPAAFGPMVIAAMPSPLAEANAEVDINQVVPTDGIPVSQDPMGRVIYVDSNVGSDSNGGTIAAPVRTITQAIATVSPGMVIQLAPGTYSAETGEQFPLEIPQGVTLRGSESSRGEGIEIIGGGRFLSRTQAAQSVAIVLEEGASARGITVSNPAIRGTGIWVEGVTATIASATLSGSHREGLFMAGSANVTVQNSVFYKNGGNGIAVTKQSRGLISGNVFDSTGYGLAIGDQASPTLQNNRIINNRDGVIINGFAQPILRGNTIENNENDGVVVIGDAIPDLGSANSPGGNQIQGNGRNAVFNATRDQIPFPFYGNTIDGPAPEQVVAVPTPIDSVAPATVPATSSTNDTIPAGGIIPVQENRPTGTPANAPADSSENESGGWANDGDGFFTP
ncbi:MAG: DUF1565 domain-containing protein [Cyanobacteria bacterium P01_D01_bin.73]